MKKNTMKRRLLSWLLTLAMLASYVPTALIPVAEAASITNALTLNGNGELTGSITLSDATMQSGHVMKIIAVADFKFAANQALANLNVYNSDASSMCPGDDPSSQWDALQGNSFSTTYPHIVLEGTYSTNGGGTFTVGSNLTVKAADASKNRVTSIKEDEINQMVTNNGHILKDGLTGGYKLFLLDNDGNFQLIDSINLGGAAKLKADPDPIYMQVGTTATVTLTNTVSGTTATINSITLNDGVTDSSDGTDDGNYLIGSKPSTVETTGTFTLTDTVGVAAGARERTLIITYNDGTKLKVPVYILSSWDWLSAGQITITGTGSAKGGTGAVAGHYKNDAGTTNPDNMIYIRSVDVSDGFTLSLENTNANYKYTTTAGSTTNTTWPSGSSGFARPGDNGAKFTDLKVYTDDSSLLVENTPIGYVTITYYQFPQGERNSFYTPYANNEENASKVQKYRRVLKVPIYYEGTTTIDPINISFSANGKTLASGSNLPSNYQLTPSTAGGTVSVTKPADVASTGFKFLGWATSSEGTAISSWPQSISGDTTYYAQWEQQYRVTYNSNLPTGATVGNGTMPNPNPTAYVDKGTNVTLTGTPTCSGATDGRAYKFKGWSLTSTGSVITVINNITEDKTVYAIWEKVPQVTFKIGTGGKFSSGNATADRALNVDANGKVTAPGVTGNTGYTFKGWNDGTSTLTEAQVNAKNHTADTTTYTAQWELRKVTGGAASGSTVKGGSMSLDSVTLSDNTTLLKAAIDGGSTDMDTIEWYLAGSKGDGDTAPNGETAMTGGTGTSVTIPTSAIEGQTIWVKLKGKGNNIATDVYWLYVGEVGKESYKFQVGIKVDGTAVTGSSIPTGVTTTPSGVQTVKGGNSFNVTASSSNVGYAFDGWDIGDATGGAFTAVNTDGSVSSFKAPETGLLTTTTYTIYAKFKSVPHLKLTDSSTALTGSEAYKGTVANDGAATAYQVKYELDGGDASDFSLSKANPTSSQLTANSTDDLTVTCTGTTDGTTYTTTLKITYSDSATGDVVGTITKPISFTYIEPRKTVHVVISVDGGTAQTAVSGISVTPNVDNKVSLKKEDTTLLSTSTAASSGYRFTGWGTTLTSPSVTPTGGTGTFEMGSPATDTTVTANYITVPYLTLAATTAGGHKFGINTVTNAVATVTNSGKANATAVAVSVGDDRFTLDTTGGGMAATGNTVTANSGTGTIKVKPVTASSLAVGEYNIPVTVTYKQVSTDDDPITLTTTVKYVVSEDQYTLTVVKAPSGTSGVTKVEYIKNGGTQTEYTSALTVKASDTVTLIATMASGYTGVWTVGNTCTAGVNAGTVLGLSAFTANTTATITASGAASLTLQPTPGSGTKGNASTLTAPKVKITNAGPDTATITNITFTSVTDSKTFTVSSTSGTVAKDGTKEVTLTPDSGWTGWDAKTYTGLVTVTYTDPAHGSTAQTATTYASFTVNAPATFNGSVTVLYNGEATTEAKDATVVLTPVGGGDDISPSTSTNTSNVSGFTDLPMGTYDVKVTVGSTTITSTKTLSKTTADPSNVTVYLSTITVATADATNGSVTLDGGSTLTKLYENGQTATIAAATTTAGTNAGYSFDKWAKAVSGTDGTTDVFGSPTTVVAGEKNTTYTASFTQGLKVTYNSGTAGNNATNMPTDPATYKSGDEVMVSTVKPTWSGYGFNGWKVNDSTSYDGGDKFNITASVTLTAQWVNASITSDGYNAVKGETTYGAHFSTDTVGKEMTRLNPGVPLKYTCAALASIGLSIDETTGVITGRPYHVEDGQTFTVTVAHADNAAASTTVTYTLDVGMAQPVLTASVSSGNQTGKTFADAKYNYTVTAPLYTVTGGTGSWSDATLMSGTAATVTATASDNAGTVDFDSSTAGTTQFTDNTNTIKLNYAPGSKKDGANNAYTAIYKTAPATLSVAGTGKVEAITVIATDGDDFGDVTDTGASTDHTTYTQPASKTYTVKNEGNVTTGAITVTAPAGYKIIDGVTAKDSITVSALDPGDTADFELQPVAQLPVGTHPGVVTASYTSGSNTISGSAPATFEVKAPSSYTGYITVKKQGVTTPATVTPGTLPPGYSVTLKPATGDSKSTSPAGDAGSTGHYTFTVDAGKDYSIVISDGTTSWTVPDKVVNFANRTNQEFTLYELKLEKDSDTGSGVSGNLTGAGWYLAGTGVSVSAPSGSGNVVFDQWKKGDAAVAGSRAITYNMPSEPVTLTAYYRDDSATTATIDYQRGTPTGASAADIATILVPNPATVSITDPAGDYTVSSLVPTLPGYVFQHWAEDSNKYSNPAKADTADKITGVDGDHTLTAVWANAVISGADVTINTTYGSGVVGQKVSATSTDSGAVKYSTSDTLYGLELDEDTGAITGIPYKVGTWSFTVTATLRDDKHPNGSKVSKDDITVTVKVDPATPTITGVTVTNVVTGAGVNTYDYVVTVAGPRYEVNGDAGTWTTYVDTLTYKGGTGSNQPTKDTSAPGNGGIGTAAFGTGTPSGVKVTFTPAGTDFDGASQDQNAVWTEAVKDNVPANSDSDTVNLTSDATEWHFDSNGNTDGGDHAIVEYTVNASGTNGLVSSNAVNAKEFTLKNSGTKATGELTYALSSTNFVLESAPTTSLDHNDTAAVKVKVAEDLGQGTYTGTLKVTGADGGTVLISLYFYVDKAPAYTGTVTVKVKDVGGSLTQGKMPSSSFTAITLVPGTTGDGISTVTLSDTYWNNTDTLYKVSTLVTGVTYTVKTGDFVLGAIAANGDNVDVELYQVVLAKDPSSLSPTLSGAGYYAKGQSASISTTDVASYKFLKWVNTTDDTDADSDGVGDNWSDVTTLKNFSAAVNDAVEYTAFYSATLTLTYDVNGGTPTDGKVVLGDNPENHNNGEHVLLQNCVATREGYTFAGWDTRSDGKGTRYQPGVTYTMPNTSTTLYAIWKANDTMSLPGNSWTVAYKDTLGDRVINAVGGIPGYTYAGSVSKPAGFSFDATDHKFSGTANTYDADTPANNKGTTTVTATDSVGATAQGSFTITVIPAATTVTTGVDSNYKPYEDDSFDFTKLQNPTVTVKRTDGTDNGDVDIDEQPDDAVGNAGEGKWKVIGTNETTKDGKPAVEYILEFTPSDKGFLPSTTKVTVPVAKRLIKTANIGIFFPKTSETPKTALENGNGAKLGATIDPNEGTATEKFTVKSVSWSETGSFSTQKPNTVWVELEAAEGWEFDANFKGTLTDQHSTPISAPKTHPDVKVVGNSGGKLTLVYTFPAENVLIKLIDIDTSIPVVNGFDTTVEVPVDHMLEYSIPKENGYQWVPTAGGDAVADAEGKRFANGAQYDLIVTVNARDGYVFDAATFAGDKPTDLTGKATVNGGNPPEGAKKSYVEAALSNSNKTLTIRYSSFIPNEKEIVGIEWVSGSLTTTDYYVMTATDKNADEDNIGAVANSIYGHDEHGAIYSAANNIVFREVYKDGDKGPNTNFSTASNALYYGETATFANWTAMPANGHVFVSTTVGGNAPSVAGTSDQTTFDGKNVYFSYTKDSKTYYALTAVGTLTVRELKADKLTPSRTWTPAELTFVQGDTLTLPATSAPTATVDFNTGVALDNSGTGWAYAATPANGSNTYFYSTDVTDAAAAKTAELKAGASVDALNGETVYMCYIDINGNLVYAPVGVLKVSGDTDIKVWISNVSDPTDDDADVSSATGGTSPDNKGSTEPEYGETIKANVEGDPKGKLTYTWKDAEGNTLQTGTSDTYELQKTDVGKTITVIVTEEGTSGSTETVNKPVGQKRSITFDVSVKDKTWDGNDKRLAQYTTDDFTIFNKMPSDTLTVNVSDALNNLDSGLKYASSAVNAVLTLPAPTYAEDGTTLTNYVLSDTDHYRVSAAQGELTPRGKILSSAVSPIILKNDDVTPVRDQASTNTAFNELTGETRYTENAAAHNAAKGTWEWYDAAETNEADRWKAITTEGALNEDGTFKKETIYRVTVSAKVTTGNKFDPNASGYFDIGGQLYPADVLNNNGTTADLRVEFPPTAGDADPTVVSHVDVSFKEAPTVDHKIPAHPMGVTRLTETQPAESYTAPLTAEDFTATWYTGANHANFDPTAPKAADGTTDLTPITINADTKFAAAAYTVVVKVKPQANYAFELADGKTEFNFHFGELTHATLASTAKGVSGVKKSGNDYYMWYSFAAAANPEIAHVNVSVPQPVVEGDPDDYGTVTVNQALGTDNVDHDTTLSVTNVTWNTSDAFAADTEYVLDFDVGTSTYDYLNGTAKVDFIVGGVGPIAGGTDWTATAGDTGAIEKVETTTTDADNTYHVKVTFKALKGGKVPLTDVYVNAPIPAADVAVTAPSVDSDKPYELTGDEKWYYWTGSAWTPVVFQVTNEGGAVTTPAAGVSADGKFLAGTDYRAVATAKLTTEGAKKYTLSATGTAFYLAGEKRTTADAPEKHPADGEKQLTANSGAAAGTFTLIREFSVPSGIEDVTMVTVTYKEPVADQAADATPTFKLTDQVNGTHVKWYTMSDKPTDKDNGFTGGTELTTNYAAGTYYMAEATVEAKTGYALTGDTVVSINDIQVTPNGAMGTKKNAKNEVTGWAMATISGGVITVKYITKTADVDTVIVSVDTGVTAPSEGRTPATAATTTQALNGSGFVVTTLGLTASGNVTISGGSWSGTLEDGKFKQGEKYSVTYTLTTKDGYTFLRDTDNDKYAAFKIAGLNVTPANVGGTVKGSATSGSGDEELKVEVLSLTTTEAQIKITFPKITEDAGIEKVAVNYTAPKSGDKPAVALNYTPPAPQVVLPQDELKTGNANGSTWHAGTNKTGSEVDKDTPFGNGDYTVATTFTAGDKFKFTSTTVFIVNGTEYSDTDTGATTDNVSITDGGKTATVWHTFPGLDKEIVKVITAVTAPVAGAVPQTTADTTLAANKADTNLLPGALSDQGKATITWTKKNASGSFVSRPAGETVFDYSSEYKASFTLTAASGYSYQAETSPADYTDFIVNAFSALNVNDTANGSHTATVDGTKVTITRADDNGSYTVEIEFPATDAKVDKLLTVNVNTTVPPAHKKTVPPVYVVATEPYAATQSGTPAVEDLHWQVKNGSDWNDVAPGAKFEAGKVYRVIGKVTLKADSYTNYDITGATKFYIGGVEIPQTATTETRPAGKDYTVKFAFSKDKNATTGVYDDDTVYTVTLTYDALADLTDKTIIKVAANVQQPVANNTVDKTVAKILARNKDEEDMLSHVTFSDVTWTVSDTENGTYSGIGDATTFVANKYYKAQFTVTANTGYQFLKQAADATADPAVVKDYVDFLINSVTNSDGTWIDGATAAAGVTKNNINVVTAEDTDGKIQYKITVTFPVTGNKADILAVWGFADIAVNTAINAANQLTVLSSEPYKIADNGAEWLVWDKAASDWRAPTAGETFKDVDDDGDTMYYKAVIKTEIKSAQTSKYQFTGTTPGYINDTTAYTGTEPATSGTHVTRTDGTAANPKYVTIDRVYTVQPEETDVHVASPIPQEGQAVPASENITVPTAYQNRYTFTAKAWSSSDNDNAEVKQEVTYTLTVTVKAKPGYKLPMSATANDLATMAHYHWDNNKATAESYTNNGDGTATVTFKYTLGGSAPEPKTPVVNIDHPVKGEAPDMDPNSPNNSVTVNPPATVWTDGNGDPVTQFEAGKSYTTKVYIEKFSPDGLTEFVPKDGDTPGTKVNFEGTEVEVQKDPDGKLYITKTWTIPADPEIPVTIVPIPGNANRPAAQMQLGDIWTNTDLFEHVEHFWTKQGDAAHLADTTTADYQTVYEAHITVRPKEGTNVGDKPTYIFNTNAVYVTDGTSNDANFIEHKDNGNGTYTLTYRFPQTGRKETETITVPGGGGGGGTTIVETPVVTYALRDLGVTKDLTAEKVKKNQNPKAVPKVDGIEGLKFVGWSETDPSTLKDGKLPTLVDPKTFKITDDKTFYAVYEKLPSDFDHTHYVIGFPDGTFGPDHNITRGQVATIIARSCLDNFIEGSNYGNPGNYTDVESHWAFSAISYCSMNGVFAGYGDGTFRPDKNITRQELATVVARLAGVQVNQGLPFSDSGDIADWAVNGVYTNYANKWVNGYTDGTFKPLNDITRSETVKIFNGYLNRGTDKEGLSELREYVHSGVASNNTENGHDEYMTWPDVAKTHWAYYEIIEAANDHNFHWRDLAKETPPEDWYECYIDEKWRYNDNADDGPDDVGRQDTLPTLTVTYVVKSNGVIWESLTEEVTQYSSPDPNKLPKAEPSEGYRFAGWSETDPDTGVVSLIDPTAHPVLEDRTFYAVFERETPAEMPSVTVTYVIGDHGSADKTVLTETIKMWESPTVENYPTVTAHEGWTFLGWSETDPAAGEFTLVDPTDHPALGDVTFYAVYEPAQAQQPEETQQPVEPQQPEETQQPDETPEPVEPQQPEETQQPDETPESVEPQQPDETPEPVEPQQPEETQPPVEPGEPLPPVEEQPVEYARYSYMSGYEDGTFRPDAPFTRAAVATVIAKLTGYDANTEYAGGDFDDLDGHWGKNAIAFCVSAGLMSGYTDNTFRPDNAISRQEFAVVLTRLAGETQSGELPFTDADAIASWAVDSVYTAYAKGWIGGYEDGTFLPERNVTRAEAVKLFNAYLGRSADRENIAAQTGYTVYEDVPETHWAYYEIIEASNNWTE